MKFRAVAVALALVFGAAGAAVADPFVIDNNDAGAKLFLNSAKDAASSTGNVGSQSGPIVNIDVSGNADFANGFANIKPSDDHLLTTITFTPADANAYASFSFRGQDVADNATIQVFITDNQGDPTQEIDFFQDKANQDFGAFGIAATGSQTIKSVELFNATGFKEGKQFEFDLAAGVPEPATWAMLIFGVGMVGFAARRRTAGPVLSA